MTVEAMSALPFQAGGAVAAAAGRAALWAVSVYMRAPLRNTAIAALVGISAMAGSNALYKQAHHHPSPLFGSFEAEAPAKPAVTKKKPAPIVPASRPKGLVSPETTGSIDPSAATPKATIDTAEVAALQQQLKALQLFEGTVDGLFGPKTAKAIKAFEAKTGRTPRGLLTPQIIALVKAAPIPVPAEEPQVPPAATAEQATQVALNVDSPSVVTAKTTVTTTPTLALTETDKPLPAPAPLLAAPEQDVQVATAEPVAETSPLLAQPDTAEQQAVTEPDPVVGPTKRSVQTIAVRAQPAPAEQEMPAPIEATADPLPALDSNTPATDPKTIAAVQRGLNSLGFLHGEINGVADEATAKAIRNFEVYFNYDVTGRITKELVRVLVQNGAVI